MTCIAMVFRVSPSPVAAAKAIKETRGPKYQQQWMIVFTEQREKVTLWLAVSREAGERVTRRREALDIQVRPVSCFAG